MCCSVVGTCLFACQAPLADPTEINSRKQPAKLLVISVIRLSSSLLNNDCAAKTHTHTQKQSWFHAPELKTIKSEHLSCCDAKHGFCEAETGRCSHLWRYSLPLDSPCIQ